MNIHDTIVTVLDHPMTVKDAERFANWCADRARQYADSARETSRKADEEYVAKRDTGDPIATASAKAISDRACDTTIIVATDSTSASQCAIYLSDTIEQLEDDDLANVTPEDEDFKRIANFAEWAAQSARMAAKYIRKVGERKAQLQWIKENVKQ